MILVKACISIIKIYLKYIKKEGALNMHPLETIYIYLILNE